MSAGPPRREHWSLRRWFTIVAVLGVVGMLVTGMLGVLALVRLDAARDSLIDRTGPALIVAQQLRAALLNQEIGVRGYVVTRDPEFAAPYRDGRATQEQVVAELRQLLSDEPLAELDTVLQRADAWQRGYAEPTMAAVDTGGESVDAGTGKVLFDALREAVAALLTTLHAERAAGAAELDAAITGMAVMGAVIAALLVALFAGTWAWARQVILRPIRSFEGAVKAVERGEFDRPVAVEGPRELEQLGTAVDAMRRRIHGELQTVQQLNEQLDAQAAELARSNSDLEQFAYVASHDLQEPLRKVSSFCELLAKRYAGQLDERADQYIGFAVDGARRMSALINDLLAFSRVGRTTDRTSWARVSAEELLAHAERNLADAIERTGAVVTHDPLPEVVGERSLLTTVLQNLVGNALKFHGEDPPRVHVGARRDGEVWEFSVSDNGIGVDPEFADKIFVIFQRLHSRDSYPGTGIGLAMCRKIVEFHGGRIWLDPDPGAPGATFRFTLPVPPDPTPQTP
ncbi:His Kinase A (phospho-acceptor) domain-containing protein [Pseudonocardia thermophila]|uniref:histidine kinase n=1 Tax=Pseudonocardia thermophila TaxID=1848 RepID=A0A1M6NSB5_PSETH|nr:sensor histidine kinase [Pseudonocardia thermophila]SHJ98657.1 His Kinase A (phospho-acceptor) domain-containing protein [Pseudonocardia thermophila]